MELKITLIHIILLDFHFSLYEFNEKMRKILELELLEHVLEK
jgi:hypothetical protein